MKNTKVIVGLLVVSGLLGIGVWAYYHVPFSFPIFRAQLALADWGKIGIAGACIYFAYVLRAIRWAIFLKPIKKVGAFSLLGTQVIGFTAVALLGRAADPVRPYLVSRKTGLPLSLQIAVYIVERIFDLGSMTLIFSIGILAGNQEALPHADLLQKVAKSGLVVSMAMAAFTIAVKVAGGAVANFTESSLGVFSASLGHSLAAKIRTFREGLATLRSAGDLAMAMVLSLAMWGLITGAYFETTKAFVASPQLAGMTFGKCMVLMAASILGGGVPIPIVSWGTQIGAVMAAMTGFFDVAPEPAMACATMLLIVTFLEIVPVGLVWAQIDKVSLRTVAAESEHAAEVVEAAAEEPETA